MDEMEKDQQFDIDEILKEFHDLPEDPELTDDLAEEFEPEEDIRIWDGKLPGKTETSAAGADFRTDTVRISGLEKARQDANEEFLSEDDTVRFSPVGQPQKSESVSGEPDTVEPYSEKWEPEYEQPIAEYIPPEPIVFRPKSRLRELKRKLVEGPEKRYYELAEQGVGKLQTAIFLNLLVALIAAGSTAMYALNLVSPDRLRLLVFGQFLALLLSALLGSYQLMDGFSDLFHKRFSLNTLLSFSFLACLADAILCLGQVRVPCCAAFSLNMTMSLWSAYQKRGTEMSQMDTMRKAIRLDSIVSTPDYHEGKPGYQRGEGQVEDFMDTYRGTSGVEKTMSMYALVALFVSLATGIAAGVMHSLHMGIQVFCASLLVAAPASSYVALSRPAALLERRLHKLGTVICGWQGVKGLSKSALFPLTDTDLFPLGSAKLNGVKFYGSRDSDEVVAYSAALICADGGSLAPLLTQLLESRSGYHYEVTELQSYAGGIGGMVNGEAVLAGSLSFMQSMGVEMPKGTRIHQAVYVAIDGTLSGVFAVNYGRVKSSATGLTTLCAYHSLTPIMVTGDFMLTESFLRGKFGVNTRRIAFPPRKVRSELAQKQPEPDAPALALTTAEGLASMAFAVTGARALKSASIVGTVVHMIGGILGVLMMIALAIVGAEHLLTPSNILIYELLWMIPGLLVTEWTRSV